MRHTVFAIMVACAAWAQVAHAQGYGFYEQSACATGRAGAGVAAPCEDGSAMFYNPAALASAAATVFSVTGTAVAPRGQFTNDTTARASVLQPRTFLVPTVYFVRPIAQRLALGVGVFAPYGLTSDWPATSEGRFLGYLTTIRAVYIQPTAAVRLTDRVSVGGGIDVTRVSTELRRRLDLAAVPLPGVSGVTFHALGVPSGTDFADADLTGTGVGVGAHVGAIAKVSDGFSLGARYLLRQHVGIDNGELAFAQIPTGLVLRVPLPGIPAGTPFDRLVAPQFATGAALASQSATTTLPLPDQLVVGAAIRASRLTLLTDYQFTNWSLLDQVVIVNQFAPATVLIESFGNTHGVRLGGEYAWTSTIVVRAGLVAHTAAAPDQSVTPLLPDAARIEFTAGAAIPIARRARLDVAYQYVGQRDRRGRTTDGGLAVPTAAINNGLYQYHANLFGLSVTLR